MSALQVGTEVVCAPGRDGAAASPFQGVDGMGRGASALQGGTEVFRAPDGHETGGAPRPRGGLRLSKLQVETRWRGSAPQVGLTSTPQVGTERGARPLSRGGTEVVCAPNGNGVRSVRAPAGD